MDDKLEHPENQPCLAHIIQLLQKMPITVDLLKKSKIGLSINQLRQYENCESGLKTRATLLVSKWKEIVQEFKSKKDVEVKVPSPSSLSELLCKDDANSNLL